MHRLDRPRRTFAVALAALAGFVDASGFLLAGGYFVSFMSGNTTRLAVDLATDRNAAIVPALLIGGFLAGVIGGALLALGSGRRRKPAVLALVTAALLAAAFLHRAGLHHAGSPALALAWLVIAMGALNNTFQRGGEVAVGLTYMTGALVRMGQGIAAALARQPGGDWKGSLMLWSGLASGAVAGALAWSRWEAGCLWLAAGWAMAMTVLALRLPAEA